MYLYATFLLYFQYSVVSSEEGDPCNLTTTGEEGTCVNVHQCPYAINLLRRGTYPQICGFVQLDSLVCCKNELENLVREQPGKLSSQKCKEYYPYAVYGIFLPGGEKTLAREFPHMAALGYGDTNDINWLCGGSLISMDFVLTAAHCLNSREFGPARRVRLGDLDFATDTDDALPQEFDVKRRIPHPKYIPLVRYHDIGLIQLDREIIRNSYVGIACLDAQRRHTETVMIATGWGKTEFAGKASTHLLKTDLDVVPYDDCRKHYARSSVELPNGIQDDLHVCGGGKVGKDTCQGDSGGPLQVRNQEAGSALFVYNITGVTSFGKVCGISLSPGVYTRVYNYLTWIENIVWPDS